MDIEEVANKNPDKILTRTIDPFTGLRPYQARKIALALGLTGTICEDCVELILNLYRACLEKDCALIEINPLVVTVPPRTRVTPSENCSHSSRLAARARAPAAVSL